MTRIAKTETVVTTMTTIQTTYDTFFTIMTGADPGSPKDCVIYCCDYHVGDPGDPTCQARICTGKEEALAIADAIYKLYEDPK